MMSTYLFLLTVSTLVVAFFFWQSGRLKNVKQLFAAGFLVVAAAIALGSMNVKAEQQARTLLQSVFSVPSDSQELIFYQKATKGIGTQEIEAVYRVGSRNPPPVSLEGAAFRYRFEASSIDLGKWIIDEFKIADGALDWQSLPRVYKQTGMRPARGHYSSRNWPDEKKMTGSYLCALIVIDPNLTDAPHKVVSCNSVNQKPPHSILLLAILDVGEQNLHVHIR